MIFVKNEDSSKILVLNIGVDDYVIKFFNLLEFVVRIKVYIRRNIEFKEVVKKDKSKI